MRGTIAVGQKCGYYDSLATFNIIWISVPKRGKGIKHGTSCLTIYSFISYLYSIRQQAHFRNVLVNKLVLGMLWRIEMASFYLQLSAKLVRIPGWKKMVISATEETEDFYEATWRKILSHVEIWGHSRCQPNIDLRNSILGRGNAVCNGHEQNRMQHIIKLKDMLIRLLRERNECWKMRPVTQVGVK